jgi:hypothetical protein
MNNKVIELRINRYINGIAADPIKPRRWHSPTLKAFNVSNTLADVRKPADDGFGAGDAGYTS